MQTISIAVSAILIAAGLITAPSLINNARDVNVKGDLANLAMAEEYRSSDAGAYTDAVTALLVQKGVKATLSTDRIGIEASDDAFALFGTSDSGRTFWRGSDGTSTHLVPTPWPESAPAAYPVGLTWPDDAADAAPPIPYNMVPGGGNFSAGKGSIKTIWGTSKVVDGGLRITPDGGSFDSFVGYTDQGEGMGQGMKAGRTYTFSGDVHVDTPSTYADADWWRARSIAVFYGTADGSLVEARREAPLVPNTVGDHHVSMTVALPDDTNSVFVRWYDGSPNAADTVTWRNLMINEGAPAPYTPLMR